MRNLWTKVSLLGLLSASMVFGSGLWSQQHKKPVEPATDMTLNPSSPYELSLVQVLFRHGARTPLWSIPDVPEAQWKPGPLLQPPAHTLVPYVVTDLQGGPQPPSPLEDRQRSHLLVGGSFPGQLTALGMQQLYDLGRRMRRRYVEETPSFLGAAFRPEEVYVRSTNMARTIESARCLIAGLFDRRGDAVVPIATADAASEILLPNHCACKRLRLTEERRWADIASGDAVPDMAADLRRVRDALGVADDHHGDHHGDHQRRLSFVLIRDNMVAREAHGLPLPAALEDAARRDTVERRAVDTMLHLYRPVDGRGAEETLRMCVGPLLRTVVDNMEDKLASKASDRKLILYSAHDTTLMPCLMALGIFDMRWPPYGADLALELHRHRETGDAFVKVSYLGHDRLLPGCSGVYCPLGEFKEALSAYSLSAEHYRTLCDSTEL